MDADSLPDLIGQSPAFLSALAKTSSLAGLDRSLLICGERGAGKELIAARLHFLSPRWEGPFVKVNCAALSEDLLESELFGHEAGAFTGAQKRHVGRFERAEGGTLFLDEIASASLRVQEKLLRIIEYGEYERLGGETTLTVNVRVVAAANVNLPARAASGAFRADLLDRLAFDVIHAPPLRARADDIPLLCAHFGAALGRELETPFPGFTPTAMAQFTAHDWPGNVRELKNAAERSFYRWIVDERDGPVDTVVIDPFDSPHAPLLDDVTSHRRNSDSEPFTEIHRATTDPKKHNTPRKIVTHDPISLPVDLRGRLREMECDFANAAMIACQGNQKEAAPLLGLTYNQMRGLVRKHKLSAVK